MSNYIEEINGRRFVCIDGYFGGREYGFIELAKGEEPYGVHNINKKVYTRAEFKKLIEDYEKFETI